MDYGIYSTLESNREMKELIFIIFLFSCLFCEKYVASW